MEQLEDRSLLAMLSIGPSGLHVSEGGTATLQVTISQMQMQPVSGTCRTVAGTAIENTDYTGFSNQSFTIPPGATFANVSVYALNDIDLESAETFSVELTSASGATIDPSASSTVVTIDNVQTGGGGGSGGSLTVSLSVPANVNEGEPFTLTGSINTTGSYQVNGAIDWGVTAGEGPTTFSVTTNPNGTFTVSHRYVDDGPDPGNGTPQDLQAITATGTATPMMPGGGGNLSVTGSTSTTIHNVAPTPVFDIYNYMPVGGPWWVASGTFQDVGLTDKGSLDIDWGDGSPHVTGNDLNVGSTFSLMHRYPPDGLSYTITITITDDDTGSATYSKGFPLYLLDLDNDANNSDEITSADEPAEPPTPGPGRYIYVNDDDDNNNDVADIFDIGSVSNENDLQPFELHWAPANRPEINNYVGWHVTLQVAPYDVDMAGGYPGIPDLNPHIYETADKGSPLPLVANGAYLEKTSIVDENVPGILYLEARQAGPIGIRLLLSTPSGGEVEVDEVLFSAIYNLPPVALDDSIHDQLNLIDPVTIDVLANDYDPGGGPLHIVGVVQPVDGYVTFTPSSVTYYPPGPPAPGGADKPGTDPDATFKYVIADAQGKEAVGKVVLVEVDQIKYFREFSRGNDDVNEKLYETATVRVELVVGYTSGWIELNYLATASTGSIVGGKPEFEYYQPFLFLQPAKQTPGSPVGELDPGVNLGYTPGGIGGSLTGSIKVGVIALGGGFGTAVIQDRRINNNGILVYGYVHEEIDWSTLVVKGGNQWWNNRVTTLDVRELTYPNTPTAAPMPPLRKGSHSFGGTKYKLPYPDKAHGLDRAPAPNTNLPANPPADWNTMIDNTGMPSR